MVERYFRMPRRTVVPLVLLSLASCGSLLQVVDQAGRPVVGAKVLVVYPSCQGGEAETDAKGWVRVPDGLFRRPLWTVDPQTLRISTATRRWFFDYPLPEQVVLDPRTAR